MLELPQTRVVPAGSFTMGENDADKFANDTERPRHRVAIRAFQLAIFPVTVAAYRGFDPAHAPGDEPGLPAVSIDWREASRYCCWLADQSSQAWRLPAEAEWEYACRAGSQTPFSCGMEITLQAANYLYDEHGEKIGAGRRLPAGAHEPNVFGLEAMHGNVCEWCADTWHMDYHNAPDDGSAWVEGGRAGWRVIRGGAWDYVPRLLRSSWRDGLAETTRRDNVGFRIACDLA